VLGRGREREYGKLKARDGQREEVEGEGGRQEK